MQVTDMTRAEYIQASAIIQSHMNALRRDLEIMAKSTGGTVTGPDD